MIDSMMGGFEYYDVVAYKNECYDTIILHITIQKTIKIIFASDSKPYCRINASNEPFDAPDKLRRLELDKGISSYEDEFTQCSFDDIKSSEVLTRFINNVVPSSAPYDWLRSQRVMNAEAKLSIQDSLNQLKGMFIRLLKQRQDV